MAVFTFVCKSDGDSWTAKQYPGDEGLEATADSSFKLQRTLTSLAVSSGASGASGAVSSSFAYITPTDAVFQVIIGGGGGFVAGGAAAPASGGGAAAAAAPAEEKEEPKKEEEESDDDMGFSLFD